MPASEETCDAVVVGAGFSGLAAARALAEGGASLRVLEARERVGGRAFTRLLADGTLLDLGGQWIGPSQAKMAELVERYGVQIYATPAEGAAVIDHGGEQRDAPPEGAAGLLDELDAMARRVPAERPWDAPEAAAWDGITFASWLAGSGRPDAALRYVARVLSGGLLAGEAVESSLLETLFYIASGGGVGPLLGYAGGAQESRIAGGAQSIAEHMAADLPAGCLRLGEPVLRIAYGAEGAHLTTSARTYAAHRVILAVPPVLAVRIAYDPPLPALKDAALQRVPAGTALKVHAVYTEPFWRRLGLSGQSTSTSGVLTETVDNTPPGGPRAVLTSFAYGDDAVALRRMDAAGRRAAVLGRLAELFGGEALAPDDFVEFDWLAEEWTRGCFSGHFTTGGATAFGPDLRTPVGPLHWAATETATVWNGYFDGAVQSGQRAAAEVLTALPALPD